MPVIYDSQSITFLSTSLRHVPSVVLYIGPDQIMPLTSVIGAIVGIALMFWNKLVGLAHRVVAMFSGRNNTPGKPSSH
jgi:hypothetical protein